MSNHIICEPDGSVNLHIKPGQLWQWCFTVGDEGTWFFEPVTEERRVSFVSVSDAGIKTIKRGDKFLVIAVDDPGPAQVPGSDIPMLDEMGYMVSPAQPPKRWHVAMLNDCLVWIDHDSFNHAELIGHT